MSVISAFFILFSTTAVIATDPNSPSAGSRNSWGAKRIQEIVDALKVENEAMETNRASSADGTLQNAIPSVKPFT